MESQPQNPVESQPQNAEFRNDPENFHFEHFMLMWILKILFY